MGHAVYFIMNKMNE